MDEFYNMVKSASVVKQETSMNDTYKTEMTKGIKRVMDSIESAKRRGLSKTCFNPGNYRYEEDIKKIFRNRGYTFSPTGYIGGVWQQTENICW